MKLSTVWNATLETADISRFITDANLAVNVLFVHVTKENKKSKEDMRKEILYMINRFIRIQQKLKDKL